jgi:hypothetical protein
MAGAPNDLADEALDAEDGSELVRVGLARRLSTRRHDSHEWVIFTGGTLAPMVPEPVALDPDPVIEAYKRDVDRTLLRENLKLSPEERLLKLQDFVRFAASLREAGRLARG